MRFTTTATIALAVAAATYAPPALADYTVRCESFNKEYKSCRLNKHHGYVRLKRQVGNSKACIKGRSWDFNRREIWVDNGCKAEFIVEQPYGYGNDGYSYRKHKSSSSDAGKAAAAIAGIAILGAILADKNDDNYKNRYGTKYESENYYGARHSSYVPSWAVGTFRGYNDQYDSDVEMRIDSDGRVRATANGEEIYGYFNDDSIHIGNFTFDVIRTSRGFETRQHGDYRNTVRYHRVR